MTAKHVALTLILCLWGVSLWNLDRFPGVYEDEPWLLAPAYKLATQGVFGSDLFTGFHHIEQHYFESMPLMSLLQAPIVGLFGVGVFQMRFAPVMLSVLTLALTYAVARKLLDDGLRGTNAEERTSLTRLPSSVGLLAMLLLLLWQWSPPGDRRFFASGIPLIDLARIARNDMLVAPVGLAALWLFLHARATRRVRFDLLSGALAGLAGLAHVYGLFWLIALLLMVIVNDGGGRKTKDEGRPTDAWPRSSSALRHPSLVGASLILLGAFLVWLPWLAFIFRYAGDYVGQNFQYGDRVALTSLSFYATNVLNEPRRYRLAMFETATYTRAGFWLLVVGVPASLAWLGARVWRERRRNETWLLVAALTLPLLFALLIKLKRYNYVAPLMPLFALLIAWAMRRLWHTRGRWVRASIVALLILLAIQGALGIAQMQSMASHVESPTRFLAELRQTVPAGARVLGPMRFWLALTDREYRSLSLPFTLSDAHTSQQPVTLDAALTEIAPRIVLIDPIWANLLADPSSHVSGARLGAFQAYLDRHRATLIAELRDNQGAFVKVYQLEP